MDSNYLNINKLFEEVDKVSGEIIRLVPNNHNSVQPIALMRLGVFVPTLKSLKNNNKYSQARSDVTVELSRLSMARAEGFDQVEIIGPRLDMDNDFKTWVGIIQSFARYSVGGDKVDLSFIEFAKLCGIPSSQSSRKLRVRISLSLKRIAGTVVSFSRKTEKHTKEYITHLVQSAYYDSEKDIVQLQADPRLFELYQFDRKVLLQLKAIHALKRKESAQALYTFIESLPRDPAPVSLARFRARLNLKSPVFSQNQTVRKAMEQLRKIGYLDYTEIKQGQSKYFCIHYRRPKLKEPVIDSARNGVSDVPAHVSAGIKAKLAQFEALGFTPADLAMLLAVCKMD
ncbi:TPA: RepB family plasmid replication initiator protein [Raoultella planticola]|nr:RepB family plasmid replication initiator protein [Raoultella planticola]